MRLLLATLFVLCAFSGLCSAAVDVLILDPFTAADTNGPIVFIIDAANLPQALTSHTQSTTIIGGERDLQLTATSGSSQSLLTSGVNGGEWAISSPPSAAGFSIMQYDGVDGTFNLNPSGLGAVDFTSSNSDALHAKIQSDHETTYTFTVYSGSGSSEAVVNIPGDDTLTDFLIPYSSFRGNADFSKVGAVEIRVEAFVDVDSFITLFATSGNPTSPPPPPPPNAPPPALGFTWYTLDDDNGRDPCELDNCDRPLPNYFQDNDNVVYYYFYGQDVVYEYTPDFYGGSSGSILVPISMLLAFVVASLL